MPDTLSDVLSLLNARSAVSTALVAGEDWSVHVAAFTGLKFNAVIRGEAWLHVEGEQAVYLRQGDCFLLARGSSFIVASDLTIVPRAASEVFSGAIGGVAYYGNGDTCYLIGGKMTLDEAVAPLLTEALPSLVHLPAAAPRAQVVHWLLARLASELEQGEPGSETQARQLMQMIFIELMREYLLSDDSKHGWLGALADSGLRRALNAMHAEPERAWRLQELADSALMSRSAFAARFKSVVGVPPLNYLIRWRMHLASQALRGGTLSIAEVAASVGYSSESAFGNAFKRILGDPPKRYLRTQPRAATRGSSIHAGLSGPAASGMD